MYCKDCGSKLILLTHDGWNYKYKCSECNLQLFLTQGDSMGGSEDIYKYSYRETNDE